MGVPAPIPGILVVGPRFVITIALTNASSCRLTALVRTATIRYKRYGARLSPDPAFCAASPAIVFAPEPWTLFWCFSSAVLYGSVQVPRLNLVCRE
jgi:hypothetical protein